MIGISVKDPNSAPQGEGGFASAADYGVCRRVHRRFGKTYYFATRRFRPEVRRRTHALYAFVRVPDEWVDNPGKLTLEQRIDLLRDWRTQLLRGLDGVRPDQPTLRAFCDVIAEANIPLEEPLAFLDAMSQDLTVSRYNTYQELRDYMRGSATAVGRMMCAVLGAKANHQVDRSTTALSEAMQLTNFLRDVGEDARRGRIYLPLEDMASFEVAESDILNAVVTEPFRNLMRFEVARARALYAEADKGIPLLPPDSRQAVQLARILYSRILDRIERQNYDVFTKRARVGKVEKVWTATRVMLGSQ